MVFFQKNMKTLNQKETCVLKLTAAFAIAKIWKQPKCPTREKDKEDGTCIRRTAAAAAKSLQSCRTLWPRRQQPTRLPRPWDSPGKSTGVGCHFLLQCMRVTSLGRVWLVATPWTTAHQAPPSLGFSRQESWSGEPSPSPTMGYYLAIKRMEFCHLWQPGRT